MPAPGTTPPASAPDDRADGFVRVRGASENTLRDVDVDIPRDRIVAFTGVSGSGKSSLAFGTVYAEAQRRFFESVAPYARRLIRQEQTPHVESITGLPPAVALQQRRGAPSTRSTVGTVTTLSNSLRMLMSRAGTYPVGQGRLDSDAFSPNTAAGACPVCHGLGVAHTVTEASLVPDPSLSIRDGAIAAWPGAWQGKNLRDIVIALGYDVDVPWRELPQEARDWILFTEEQPVVQITPQRDRVAKPYNGRFWSARSYVLHTLADSASPRLREAALAHMVSGTCERCGGSGLTPEALAVTFAGRSIQELNALTLADLARAIAPADGMGDVAVTITTDLVARLAVLVDLGLGYLSLGRVTTTLSPGEMQRLRLATQLRSGLFGVVYVLDEPSAGLHPADAEPLLEVLEQLRDSGNSVFVVEHDMDVVRRADWIVDVGPGAGQAGGSVLYSGPVAGLREVEASATRPHLFPDLAPPRAERTPRTPTGSIRATGVTLHNLVDLDVEIPLGVMVAVTGVSGSGKSTLVSRVLPDLLRASLAPDRVVVEAADDADGDDDAAGPARIARVEGAEAVDRLVSVDQRPIGRTPRSTLATYTGLFDAVRRTYAATDEARARGYGAGRFSFNVAGGRCETCQGEGSVTVELLFLPGSYGPCPTCHGARYEPATLEIEYHGRSIADVLGMTVDEARGFLADVPLAARALATLRDVGLGYLRLGQPATELSGGEAQRIKLATELQRAPRGHTLYLLDEPTTGLHPADVVLLLRQLQGLVDAGNTVVVVEHEMDVVADADRVIDLGPSGGDHGGRIVAQGTPREVADTAGSRTAPYLARRLDAS
ncbi:excinuclease ABC subunit UvrA [Clavibacter capsici]|uniref:excinuclease ABC subunit UvrA n=1 Tax=Clavibacter capsici TaxID=1874630 RepID=UPI00293E2940|nr:excinuclease ABC subunit UvrA [Clavibacter capsici]